MWVMIANALLIIQAVEIPMSSHDGEQDSRPPSVESLNNKMHRLKPDVDGGLNRSNSNRAWSPSPMRRAHSPQPFYRYCLHCKQTTILYRYYRASLDTQIRRDMSPLPPRRSHDIGFSDAVSDMVDIVKHETSRRGRARGNELRCFRLSTSFQNCLLSVAKLRGDEYSLSRTRTPTRQERHIRSRMIHPSMVP